MNIIFTWVFSSIDFLCAVWTSNLVHSDWIESTERTMIVRLEQSTDSMICSLMGNPTFQSLVWIRHLYCTSLGSDSRPGRRISSTKFASCWQYERKASNSNCLLSSNFYSEKNIFLPQDLEKINILIFSFFHMYRWCRMLHKITIINTTHTAK